MMVNVIGKDTAEETLGIISKAYSVSGAGIHWYGKPECRLGRKMAHITLTADTLSELIANADQLGVDRSVPPLPPSISLLLPLLLTPLLSRSKHGLECSEIDPSSSSSSRPQVGIIMGSDSDLPTMKAAAEILDHFSISYELSIVSAHRTPNRMYSYAQSAVERGIQVIIAGAGGAAHLPGMVAALTPLPVIGVPVKSSTLNGNDSLLSIVQMPKGIPVATVAIGNAANAGLLAVRILGAAAASASAAEREGRAREGINYLQLMEEYMSEQEEEVLRKAVKLETIGYDKYLTDMK
jgi:phosphoribosylaminoimidazole carboxylase